MSGIFGGAKADRAQQTQSRGDLTNVFNYALPTAQTGQAAGSANVGAAGDFFKNLLRSSRSDVEQSSAPAINANLSAEDAMKRREAVTGTGRTGGTAELDRMSDADTTGKNADLINKTLETNKQVGSQGLLQTGDTQMRNALQMLGLSDEAINQVLGDATKSRAATQSLWGNILTAGTNSILGGAAGDVSTGLQGIFKAAPATATAPATALTHYF